MRLSLWMGLDDIQECSLQIQDPFAILHENPARKGQIRVFICICSTSQVPVLISAVSDKRQVNDLHDPFVIQHENQTKTEE